LFLSPVFDYKKNKLETDYGGGCDGRLRDFVGPGLGFCIRVVLKIINTVTLGDRESGLEIN
jgi:hypothetical protein